MTNHNNNHNEFDLAMEVGELKGDVGELKGMVGGINQRLDRQNGSIGKIIMKVEKHDITLAKIAWLGSLTGTVIATIVTFALHYIFKF